MSVRPQPFLRIPPFPGARLRAFGRGTAPAQQLGDDAVDELLAEVRRLRVGGAYWGGQPRLPDRPYVLVTSAAKSGAGALGRSLPADAPAFYPDSEACDPWHMLSGASHVVADADEESALIAAISGIALTCVGEGRFSALAGGKVDEAALRALFREAIGQECYLDPYTNAPMNAREALRLCGFWRQLIDGNRNISAAVGFGFWKRGTVAPLLWNGSQLDFGRADPPGRADVVAIWKTRTPAPVLKQLAESKSQLIEVEDGFIRSAGLGADCVPPLSIVVDPVGIYFDPARPSLLEQLIQSGPFSPQLLQRAQRLRELIVSSGVSKYGAGSSTALRRRAERPHILVPGQVEDDRSVQCGGGEVRTNLELLRRVRRCAPEAYIIYKPHPDVEAGHRVGAIPEKECLALADEIVRNERITALIELVDGVHVNTSLAGFEALLRGKPVTTHGVPFYAGWGLTRDLGDVPGRRTARRTVDELVAAALLLYPRYLDPVTGLPCPPEILVQRIAERHKQEGAVVQIRRLQGRFKKLVARARTQ